MSNQLDVQRLSLAFGSENAIETKVKNLSFSLSPGEMLALVGESGSGKSISALSILQLLPCEAKVGMKSKIVLNAQDLLHLSADKMRRLRGNKGCHGLSRSFGCT